MAIGENGSAWGRKSSLSEKAAEWSDNGIGTNAAMLVGLDSVRRQVLASPDAEPSPQQLETMRGLVREAMEDGAFGVSSGLDYYIAPSRNRSSRSRSDSPATSGIT